MKHHHISWTSFELLKELIFQIAVKKLITSKNENLTWKRICFLVQLMYSGGGYKGRSAVDAFFLHQGSEPLIKRRLPLSFSFTMSNFGRPTRKFFLKEPSAPLYTNFEGDFAPKNLFFGTKSFKKYLITSFIFSKKLKCDLNIFKTRWQ